MEKELPIGFRFYPTEEELISFYLVRKLDGRDEGLEKVIPELYIYHLNPWDLPKSAGDFCKGEREQWFFFIPRQEKELRGGRPNRLTSNGYWKATGSPSNVYSSENRIIGEKRTMVFYKGRASSGEKTEWKMNEYRAAIDQGESSTSNANAVASTLQLRQEFCICRVYLKSKCLRAFDRRPFGEVGTSSSYQSIVSSHDIGNHEKGDNDDHLASIPLPTILPSSSLQQISVENPRVEIANSPNSSSSVGDHANTIYDRLDMEEPMWDWEELNMF